jgi:hypothetical protein
MALKKRQNRQGVFKNPSKGLQIITNNDSGSFCFNSGGDSPEFYTILQIAPS